MDNLIIFGAKYLVFIIPLFLFIVMAQLKGKNRWQLAVVAVLAVILAVFFSKLSGLFYFHHRPFIVQNIQPLVSHPDDNGFPSDHTLLATTLATVIYFYHRRLGILALILALIVGIARILAHVHWPIDIVGGLLFGFITGWVSYNLVRRLLPSSQQTAVDQKHQ